MPRQLRIEYPGAIYHVMNRGDHRYLRTVCAYVRLNPVRARLLRREQKLRDFPWSSWPEYLKAPDRRAPWLRAERLLGEYHIPHDSDAGREYLETCLEQRRA